MRRKLFPNGELEYYGFGLRVGLSNVVHNGLRLGFKKTLGKILQPINSYTRFPEYHFVGQQIRQHLRESGAAHGVKILDVGSPKCFGLHLACQFDIEIHLTDIYEPAVEECRILWKAVQRRARGKAVFSVQDGRSLEYTEETFDVVYSMSVIEHVFGESGDSLSLQEMIRVLKPGGILVVTVPLGQRYVEQNRLGFEAAARTTGNNEVHFFQRIYAPAAVESRILKAAAGADLRHAATVGRQAGIVSKFYGHLGETARGLFGCLNPLLSRAWNHTREGISPVPGSYTDLHSKHDVCGDLMLAWEKRRGVEGEETPIVASRTAVSTLNPSLG